MVGFALACNPLSIFYRDEVAVVYLGRMEGIPALESLAET